MDRTCTTCPRPVPDTAYGCIECAARLAGRMGQIAGVAAEVDTTIAKQDRIGSGGPRATGAEIPLPYNAQAAEQGAAVAGELTTWARHVQEQTGRDVPHGHPVAAAAQFLAGAMTWLRYRPEWSEAHAALSPLLKDVLRIIDIQPERRYVGPCSYDDPDTGQQCLADVYARPHAVVAVCLACGTEYDVEQCQEWMRQQLEDLLARPIEIAGIMQRLGLKIGYSTIAAYAQKGLIAAHGHDAHLRPMYRVGDVLDVRLGAGRPRHLRQARGMAHLREG